METEPGQRRACTVRAIRRHRDLISGQLNKQTVAPGIADFVFRHTTERPSPVRTRLGYEGLGVNAADMER